MNDFVEDRRWAFEFDLFAGPHQAVEQHQRLAIDQARVRQVDVDLIDLVGEAGYLARRQEVEIALEFDIQARA